MKRHRKFYKSGFQHLCQKSADNGIIFIELLDFIVLFTNICVKAVKHNVCIIAICIMFNHFHIEAAFENERIMARFMNGLTSVVARAQNRQYNTKGQVFKKPYKNASKYGKRAVKDNFIYIGNNPVEKKIVNHAEDYRWNFIKYLDSADPFSEPIDFQTASASLIELVKKVKELHEDGKAIGYKTLGKKWFLLDDKERNQLVDFIISTYNVIDKKTVMNLFGSYEGLTATLNAITGSEYDINDDLSKEDYRKYIKMREISREEGVDLHKIHFRQGTQRDASLSRLISRCINEVQASEYEIKKFFHLK